MSFDIDHYAQTSTRITWDDLDMSTFATKPLSEDALRCLSYMSDVETHTVCYLRDLLVTPSHADPEVTVFLTMWNLEEYWHGNEWCAHSAYTRLIRSENHPVLTEILRRIAKQETRHVAFYNSQARERLQHSKKAQRIARFALKKAWGIVGSTLMPKPEVKHMLGYLYGGEEGLAEVRRVDAKIDALPGQQGLHLVENQLIKYGVIAA